ncbi:MAG: ABC transporter ATP-binding protein [Methylomicrobium sp.]|nr:ABC transporter ATP-binding protein [Methylomicrobium sp.]
MLVLNDISKAFHSHQVLRDVNLEVSRGEVVSLVGGSGSGKSTLLRIIGGLSRFDRGSVRVNGKAINGRSREIGFVFQEPRLLPWLTVHENVGFAAGKHERSDPYIDELLDEVGLKEFAHVLPKQLSGGMAQRVSLARGLYTRPPLLLLDEPFSAVDAFTRISLQQLLAKVVRHHHVTVVLVTHDVEEAVYLSDRVYVLGGRPAAVVAEVGIAGDNPRKRNDEALIAYKNIILDHLESVTQLNLTDNNQETRHVHNG